MGARGLADFAGRVAVVTGASSGIGAATALQLARRGASVALVARREELLREQLAEIEQAGGSASVHPCDVADRSAVDESRAEILERWGRIDLLVNSAGFARHILFVDHDLDDIERMLATNVLGTMYWIKAALSDMRARGEGWVVNLSSFAGLIGQPDESVYSASKFAVTGLSQAIAAELEEFGIHVLCVHPTLVRTEMFTPEVLERMPTGTLSSFIEPEQFVAGMLEALRRGEREVTLPRRYGWVPLLRALFPGFIGRSIARVKLAPLR